MNPKDEKSFYEAIDFYKQESNDLNDHLQECEVLLEKLLSPSFLDRNKEDIRATLLELEDKLLDVRLGTGDKLTALIDSTTIFSKLVPWLKGDCVVGFNEIGE